MQKFYCTILTMLLWSFCAMSLPERVGSIGLSSGVPQLVALEGQVMMWRRWQLGFGYGLLPNSVLPEVKLPTQTLTLSNGSQYAGSSTASVGLSTLSPLIRYFPGEDNFYFQFSYNLIRLNTVVKSTLQPVITSVNASASISGSMSITQHVPTLSIGNIFMSKLFFVNLSLGVSFLFKTTCDVSLAGIIPDVSANAASNQAGIAQLENQIKTSVLDAVDKEKGKFSIFPSIAVSVGIVL